MRALTSANARACDKFDRDQHPRNKHSLGIKFVDFSGENLAMPTSHPFPANIARKRLHYLKLAVSFAE